MTWSEVRAAIHQRANSRHGRIPALRKLPLPAVAIITGLVLVNVMVWVAVGVVLHFHPALISTATLSYVLGLRHALDADHISVYETSDLDGRIIVDKVRPSTL